MKPTQDTEQQTTQSDGDARPTMQDLWLRHPEIQNAGMIEAPAIPYLRVLFVFCGYKVTQVEFDAVLNALNRLTGCHYIQDDIAGVCITLDTSDSLMNIPNQSWDCHSERSEESRSPHRDSSLRSE